MSKTVLITGASRGLGWDLAHHFLAQGWNVLVNARTHAAVEELIQAGAVGVWGSITTEFTRTELTVLVKTTGLDLLIHNAGTRPDHGWADLSAKEVSKTI
ncbi:MAG: SDR family NAD(P)-dependent oxidoreductase, partial [Bellilinea sp.]